MGAQCVGRTALLAARSRALTLPYPIRIRSAVQRHCHDCGGPRRRHDARHGPRPRGRRAGHADRAQGGWCCALARARVAAPSLPLLIACTRARARTPRLQIAAAKDRQKQMLRMLEMGAQARAMLSTQAFHRPEPAPHLHTVYARAPPGRIPAREGVAFQRARGASLSASSFGPLQLSAGAASAGARDEPAARRHRPQRARAQAARRARAERRRDGADCHGRTVSAGTVKKLNG